MTCVEDPRNRLRRRDPYERDLGVQTMSRLPFQKT